MRLVSDFTSMKSLHCFFSVFLTVGLVSGRLSHLAARKKRDVYKPVRKVLSSRTRGRAWRVVIKTVVTVMAMV